MHRKGGRYGLALYLILCWVLLCGSLSASPQTAGTQRQVPILVYHRFGPVVADGMTVRTATFEAHLRMLTAQGYRIVPLDDVVSWAEGGPDLLPAKAVAMTADDGHRSVFDVMMPIVQREQIPVTLFIYPSAISNASYALTWNQLRELKKTGLFSVQSHSYWHPNFNTERKRLAPAAFRALAHDQLRRARERLEQELGGSVTRLAWPFGIYDRELMEIAASEGVEAAFSLDGRPVTRGSPRLALPRFLMVDACDERCLGRLLDDVAARHASSGPRNRSAEGPARHGSHSQPQSQAKVSP